MSPGLLARRTSMAIYGDRIANEVFRLPALRLKAYGRNVLRQRVAEKNDQEHRQRSDQQSSLEILHAYIPPISGIPVAFIPTKKTAANHLAEGTGCGMDRQGTLAPARPALCAVGLLTCAFLEGKPSCARISTFSAALAANGPLSLRNPRSCAYSKGRFSERCFSIFLQKRSRPM